MASESGTAERLVGRLDAVGRRLRSLAEQEPTGLTTADQQTGERWEAGQAWGHVAEFPGYWLSEVRRILAADPTGPHAAFGRTTTDAARLRAIEGGRTESRQASASRALDGIAEVRTFLRQSDPATLSRRGMHATRGELDVAEIVERFVVGHLEEHADQLAALSMDGAG